MRGDVWSHKTSLALPLFIKVPVPSKESEQGYRFYLVLGFFYWILDFCRQCVIFFYRYVIDAVITQFGKSGGLCRHNSFYDRLQIDLPVIFFPL